MAETLGDRIRKARLCYGMSQAELARRIRKRAELVLQSLDIRTRADLNRKLAHGFVCHPAFDVAAEHHDQLPSSVSNTFFHR